MANIKAARADAAKLKVKSLSHPHKEQISTYDEQLGEFRLQCEAAVASGKSINKEDIKAAEKAIKAANDDMSGLNKLLPKNVK